MTYSKKVFFFGLTTLLFLAGCIADTSQSTEVVFKQKANEAFVHFKAEPDRLIPFLTVNAYSNRVLEKIFQGLIQYNPQTLELEPWLATSMPSASTIESGPFEGNIAYTFEIRPEAKWANGSPVLASDYLFTLKSIFNPLTAAGVYRNLINFIADVELDPENDRRFTILTNKHNMNAVYMAGFFVLPEYLYDPKGLLKDIPLENLTSAERAEANANNLNLQQFAEAFNSSTYTRETVSGSGAYELVDWTTGQQIVLTKKENWWGDALADVSPLFKALPEKITYKIIPDDISAIAVLKDQDLDVMAAIPDQQFADLQNNEDFLKYYALERAPTLSTAYIGLNNENPKLEDKAVRKALAYAIDVDEMIETLKYGNGERVSSPIPPAMPYYNKDLPLIGYSPETALELLKEAGWQDLDKDGIVEKEIDGEMVPLIIQLHAIAQLKIIGDIAALVKNSAKKAGIEIEIIAKDFNTTVGDVQKGEYEAYILSSNADLSYYDPYQSWHSQSRGNYVRFNTSSSDQLIEQLRQTRDDNERLALYKTFQELVFEEQPWIFLYSTKQGIAISKRFAPITTTIARPGYKVNEFLLKN